jgi:hypothetical protein
MSIFKDEECTKTFFFFIQVVCIHLYSYPSDRVVHLGVCAVFHNIRVAAVFCSFKIRCVKHHTPSQFIRQQTLYSQPQNVVSGDVIYLFFLLLYLLIAFRVLKVQWFGLVYVIKFVSDLR